jgi:hypothetical protein
MTMRSRPKQTGAKITDYVLPLSDGETKGFWMLPIATPIRGRAIPCHFITYSSATLNNDVSSCNLEHQHAIQGIKEFVGNRTMIYDREFSFLGFLQNLDAVGTHCAKPSGMS